MMYAVVYVLGIATGWIIFERPQWASDALAWFKAKLQGLWTRGQS